MLKNSIRKISVDIITLLQLQALSSGLLILDSAHDGGKSEFHTFVYKQHLKRFPILREWHQSHRHRGACHCGSSQTGGDSEAGSPGGDNEADAGVRTSTNHRSRDVRKRSGVYCHAERIDETRVHLFLHGYPGSRRHGLVKANVYQYVTAKNFSLDKFLIKILNIFIFFLLINYISYTNYFL